MAHLNPAEVAAAPKLSRSPAPRQAVRTGWPRKEPPVVFAWSLLGDQRSPPRVFDNSTGIADFFQEINAVPLRFRGKRSAAQVQRNTSRLIPSLFDQDPWAQSRRPSDMMRQG